MLSVSTNFSPLTYLMNKHLHCSRRTLFTPWPCTAAVILPPLENLIPQQTFSFSLSLSLLKLIPLRPAIFLNVENLMPQQTFSFSLSLSLSLSAAQLAAAKVDVGLLDLFVCVHHKRALHTRNT
jgi:hypothetical protein